MTASRALPAAVVERCRSRLSQQMREMSVEELMRDGCAAITEAALAEFLRIIEERGLRIVPVAVDQTMTDAGRRRFWCDPEDTDLNDGVRWAWQDMLEAAPPLAELLEERDGV